jgi:hypothetical protein
MNILKFALLLVAILMANFVTLAHAETYLMMQYNDSVRILLAKTKCEKAGYRAAAQRVDKQYLRGCWSREPHEKLVRIQWEGGDFSVFDADRFQPVEAQ